MIGLKLFLALGLAFIVAVGGVVVTINNRAFDRGFTARDTEARAVITRMETRLREQLEKNQNKTDAQIDCELIRLRNPKAECGR